jgi:hypothetical protein
MTRAMIIWTAIVVALVILSDLAKIIIIRRSQKK